MVGPVGWTLMNKIGMVVNYYWNSTSEPGRQLVTLTTQTALTMLKLNPIVGSVVLVDGSPRSDPKIRNLCLGLSVNYLHAGRELSLPEGYNVGWQSLSEDYVGLMANDILPHPPDTMRRLLYWIRRPGVGCVFPYLTSGSNYTQRFGFFRRGDQTSEPASMTLNLNVFRRSVLEEVGGVDEGYRVGYYDPILLIKIRRLGFRVILVGKAHAIHCDKLTKKLGGSTLGRESYRKDTLRWASEYPKYFADDGIGHLNFWPWPCATTLPAMMLWWFSHKFPFKRWRYRLFRLSMWLEPYLTKYPARYGTRKFFSQARNKSAR
jgi:hypothetical protein